MAIEFTQRSTIHGYPQGAESSKVRPLALDAREADNAFHARPRQAAGSARRFASLLSHLAAGILALIAIFELEMAGNITMEFNMELKVRKEMQVIIIRDYTKDSADQASHAQFAVSQVALKAILWQPTDCDSYRYSNMAIEFTQRSTIHGYPQGAESFIFPLAEGFCSSNGRKKQLDSLLHYV